MKKFKIIILLICTIFLLSGCTIKSDVTLNHDGTVKEEVSVLANSKIFESEINSKEKMIDSVIEPHLKALQFKEYDYDYILGDDLSGAKIYKSYGNICDYFKNTAFNQYVYKYMNCIENDYYYEISNDTEYIPYCSDCSDWPALNDIEFKITLPIKAEEQNADEIDGNTYIWRYDENTRDKSFYLKISKSALEQSEAEYNANVSRKKTINTMLVVVGVVALLAIIGFVGVVLYKKYQRNKLDY